MKLKSYIKYKIKNKLEPIEFKFIFLLVSKVFTLTFGFLSKRGDTFFVCLVIIKNTLGGDAVTMAAWVQKTSLASAKLLQVLLR